MGILDSGSYICAPSESAMNGNSDQSFSAAGSVPSGPMHSSISGPLYKNGPLVLCLTINCFHFLLKPDSGPWRFGLSCTTI